MKIITFNFIEVKDFTLNYLLINQLHLEFVITTIELPSIVEVIFQSKNMSISNNPSK